MQLNPLRAIAGHGVVPVTSLESVAHARTLADALVAGGLPVLEVTLRTPAALECVHRLAERGDILVGAGTVRTIGQVDRAVAAGARFIVSPGVSPAVIERCREHDVLTIPGAVTASEIQSASDLGVTVVKFFPAEVSGGAGAIAALSGPFPEVRFVPTGGIGEGTFGRYLALPSVAAVGGSWMVSSAHLADADVAGISSRIAVTVAAARQVRGRLESSGGASCR